ncbi:hypothetical protein BEP19_13325 [Ammoniphilus oxalaticus]|uniref:D-glucuronyl C5-epimerase C-terminal domain-containing protein n=1 Tax=Ammoniphilus oxalaticus TaxID=66863 RepID=A0A419SHD1_9BACL|nr:hypothetical protein [Ammoniphilus oxalaticus]RKD23192.1 hypothetical protein BEP19_13325 [Ammoniphilus oxalaticus]
MLNKKWFAVSVLIIFVFYSSLPVTNASEGHQHASFSYDLNGDQQRDYELRMGGWAENVEPELETVYHEHATYHHYRYRQGQNYLRLTIMSLQNGDILYTARNYLSPTANEARLSIVAYDGQSTTARRFIPPTDPTWDAVNQQRIPGNPPSWQQLEQLPTTTPTALYLDSERLHYRVGQADLLKPIGHTVFQEVAEQRRPTEIVRGEDRITYTVPLPTNATVFSDTWGLLSTKPLIKWDNPAAVREASQLELQHDKKLSVDGAYYLTPNNYRPYAPNSFYLNPANVLGMRMVPLIDAEINGTLFEDVATHLAYASIKRQNAEGFWPTVPKSLWLSGDYQIEYNYMDNRRNADNVTFLMRFMKKKEGDPQIAAALKKWDDYQQNYIKKHAVPTPNGGILVPDYVGGEGSQMSHISLNHHLSNLMYLLESYRLDQDPQKLALAEPMLTGVESTAMLWVMPDHNLYYALTPGLKPYKPDQYPDYHSLTRDDLEVTQWLLTTVGKPRSPQLQLLIEQKNIWISHQ